MQKTSNKKVVFIMRTLCLIFVCLGARLFYLQINLAPYFIQRSQKNFLRLERTHAIRGNIFDCKGALLATNRPVINLWWSGTGNRRLTSEQQDILTTLENILCKQIKSTELYSIIEQRERLRKRVKLTHDLSAQQLSAIEELFLIMRILSSRQILNVIIRMDLPVVILLGILSGKSIHDFLVKWALRSYFMIRSGVMKVLCSPPSILLVTP